MLATLLALTALPAWADNTIMCMGTGNSEEMCTCAAETLAGNIEAGNLAGYDAISAIFAEQRAEGAWLGRDVGQGRVHGGRGCRDGPQRIAARYEPGRSGALKGAVRIPGK